MLRRRAAAAADESNAVGDEAARVRGHVFGRAQVDVAAFDLARLAGVGLRRELHGRDPCQALDRLEHRRRTDAAVEPDDIRSPALELGHERLRRRAVARVAIFLGRHLGNDRQVADRAHATNGSADLVDVAEGLEHEQVDAAVDEGTRLLGEILLRFVNASLPPGLDANAKRADRARDPGLLFGGTARQPRALEIDRVHLVRQAEVAQLDAVRAEGVGFDHVRAIADVGLVDLGDEIRLGKVQLVKRAIEKDALGIEHRAHRTVAHEHAPFEFREK